MFIGFALLHRSGFVSLRAFQTLMGEENIALPARGLGDMILCQPMDEVDVCAQQAFDTRHLLDDEIAVMDQEL
jgi:hypothetical protein